MTTNQTIDGVPRKLLNNLLAWLKRANERNEDGDIAEYVELRALLYAPEPTVFGCNRCGGTQAEWTAKCVHCYPAAQPQGDAVPVSAHWSDWSMVTLEIDGQHRTYVECGKSQGDPVAEIASKFGDPEAFGERELIALKDISKLPYGTKLYAEQPAPVAVDAARAFAKGFNTLEQADGKYRINMQFYSRDDAWAAYTALGQIGRLNPSL